MLGKKYTARQYSCAAFIMLGCFLFLITGSIKPHRHTNDSSALYGICLMTCYLAFDGFTSTFQDKLFRGFAMSSAHQSLYTTMFSIGISFLGTTFRIARCRSTHFRSAQPSLGPCYVGACDVCDACNAVGEVGMGGA